MTENPPSQVTDTEVQRLLCAIFPSRLEARLSKVVTWCYERNEGGALGFVGDRADDIKVRSLRIRAWRKVRAGAAQ